MPSDSPGRAEGCRGRDGSPGWRRSRRGSPAEQGLGARPAGALDARGTAGGGAGAARDGGARRGGSSGCLTRRRTRRSRRCRAAGAAGGAARRRSKGRDPQAALDGARATRLEAVQRRRDAPEENPFAEVSASGWPGSMPQKDAAVETVLGAAGARSRRGSRCWRQGLAAQRPAGAARRRFAARLEAVQGRLATLAENPRRDTRAARRALRAEGPATARDGARAAGAARGEARGRRGGARAGAAAPRRDPRAGSRG